MPEPSEAAVLAALAAVVQDHGWRLVSSPARLRASLSDLLGARVDDHQAAVDALVVSAEEGVPQQVREVGRPGLAAVRPLLVERLREWGMSDERADWVVQSWAELLPVSTSPHLVPVEAPTPVTPPAPRPEVAPPTAAPPGVTEPPPVGGGTRPDPEPGADTLAEPRPAGHDLPTILPPVAGPAAGHAAGSGTPTPGPSGPGLRRRLALGSSAALLLVGAAVVAAVVVTGDGDPDPQGSSAQASDPESSTTPTPEAPEAEGGEIGTVPEDVAVAPAAGRFVMAGRSGGVRLAGLDEVDQISNAGTVKASPAGGRLIGFRLDDVACGVPPCTPWTDLGLKVAVGSDVRRLPKGGGPFVVAVPAGVEDVDLMMRGDGYTQTLSLLDGTPGEDNIEVLARPDRAVKVGSRFTVTERTSIPLAYVQATTSTVPRAVDVERAELTFFVNGLRPASVDRAFLSVRLSYTIPYSVAGGAGPGTPRAFLPDEVRFVSPQGKSYPAEDLDPGPGINIGFEVPADLRRGTLRIGGSYGLTAGDGVTPFTVDVSERSVPIRFR